MNKSIYKYFKHILYLVWRYSLLAFSGTAAFIFLYILFKDRKNLALVLFSILIIFLIRTVCKHFMESFLNLYGKAKKVLIVGTGPIAQYISILLSKSNNVIIGYYPVYNEPIVVSPNNIISDGTSICEVAKDKKVDKILLSVADYSNLEINELLNCKLQHVDILDAPSFYERITGKIFIESMPSDVLSFLNTAGQKFYIRIIKRVFDIAFALIGIVCALPIFIIIPVLIKLESKGPVLYKQVRVGEAEKHFNLYKFRTMISGAEKNTDSFKPRLTRVGKFLRKTCIDELPQLFHILIGNMSFIGPRPESPFFIESVKKQIPYYSERHCVKPGITGWAQVRLGNCYSLEDTTEKLKYDLYYIKYVSWELDLLLMLDAIKTVLFGIEVGH